MATDEEVKKIVKEAYDYEREQKKIRGQKENNILIIVVAAMIVGVTILVAYTSTEQDRNSSDVGHMALSHMSCNELKALMQDVNNKHSNDELYSYAITDISHQIEGVC